MQYACNSRLDSIKITQKHKEDNKGSRKKALCKWRTPGSSSNRKEILRVLAKTSLQIPGIMTGKWYNLIQYRDSQSQKRKWGINTPGLSFKVMNLKQTKIHFTNESWVPKKQQVITNSPTYQFLQLVQHI